MELTKIQDGLLRHWGDNILTKCSRKHKSCYFKYSKSIKTYLDNGKIEIVCPKCGDGILRNVFIMKVIN
jgi:hypothetical protein